jgi:hypothetical protein
VPTSKWCQNFVGACAHPEGVESLTGVSWELADDDRIDTSVLAEVAGDRVDVLITEDRNLHKKAARLGLASRVFTIDAFLEKVTAENPALADYKVLSVKKVLFVSPLAHGA